MKDIKQLFLICAIVFSTVLVSRAQSFLGGGLAYGTDIDELGITIDGEFFIRNNLAISPDVIIYFVDDGRDFKQGFWEFNMNANWYLVSSGAAAIYGVGGINLSTSTYKPDAGDRDSESGAGLNLGIGSNFDIDSAVKPFAELKFTIGDYDQAALIFGIHFNIY